MGLQIVTLLKYIQSCVADCHALKYIKLSSVLQIIMLLKYIQFSSGLPIFMISKNAQLRPMFQIAVLLKYIELSSGVADYHAFEIPSVQSCRLSIF